MPLRKGEKVGSAIKELRTGPRYKKAAKKRGRKAAERQALAIALKNSRLQPHKPHRKRMARR